MRRGRTVLGGLAGVLALSAIAGLLVTVAVTPALAITGTAASSAINAFDNLPSDLAIDGIEQPTTIWAKDASTGQYQVLARFYDENRTPVAWNAVAPVMYDAILSSEDPRFYEEGGVDIIGTTRALLSNLQGDSDIQGGSSISQQYVKNVLVQECYTSTNSTGLSDTQRAAALQKCYTSATNANGAAGYERKLQEMRYAIALDQKYSKNQILLGYLNIANFGGVTYGIEAAAEYYFGIHAQQLDLAQAATLAGMVQNPNTYRIDEPTSTTNGAANGYALTKQREEYVLGRMKADGKISDAQYQQAVKEPITPNITQPSTGCGATAAPYYCAYVESIVQTDPAFGATAADRETALKAGGLNIYTTLDWNLQNAAQATVSRYAPGSVSGYGYGSTIVNVQPSTGDILSIAQNTTYTADASMANTPGYTGIVYAGDHRQGSIGFPAGSAFKIFTLLDWLQTGHSLGDVLNGKLQVFDHLTNSCQGDWTNTTHDLVRNFNNEPGFVGTPLQFTAQSLNTGFFAMASKLDLCDVANDATELGVQLANGKGAVPMTTLSSVIGSNAVSPIAMAGAYAALADNGTFCTPTAIAKVTDSSGKELPLPAHSCTPVIDPKIAATAIYAFEGVMRGGGTGAQGNPEDGTAVYGKTGTNEGNQTWLIESSTAMTSLVWSGVTDDEGDENIDLFHSYYRGEDLADIRYAMAKAIQRTADQYYPGGTFAAPDPTLTEGSRSTVTPQPDGTSATTPAPGSTDAPASAPAPTSSPGSG
jgi:membrane peptidoglycan carboxypeptidase